MSIFDKIKRRSEEPAQEAIKPGADQTSIEIKETKGDKVTRETILRAISTLEKYKEGKAALETRLIENEQWWKMRNWERIQVKDGTKIITGEKPNSAYLFNCIVSKHADYLDAYPEPNILPREIDDQEEAKRLSEIVPVIMEQTDFESVYNNECWKKLKAGGGVYGVFWDSSKYNGLGDIAITNIDLLNLFWEPGIQDIQDSANIFHVNLVDNEVLEQRYPELKGKLNKDNSLLTAKYLYDENIDTTDKSAVVDWYYHTEYNGKKVLQYCKFVNDEILYATENDIERDIEEERSVMLDEAGQPVIDDNGMPIPVINQREIEGTSIAERGLYEHGLYPFVVDNVFPVEGSLIGISYIDVGKGVQEYIDKINKYVLDNLKSNSKPRWFLRGDGQLNEQEVKDVQDGDKQFIHFNGNLDQDNLVPFPQMSLDGNYMNMLQQKIQELKETTGNTDVSQGIPTGVTSGSAISALQEAAGKTSRAENKIAYDAYRNLINMVIELIRQFYDIPRQFRITGENGQTEFVDYDNTNIQPQYQGNDFGNDMGYRLPVFDIEVVPQRQNPYTKNGQNETVMTLYNMGVFNPEMGDQAVALLESMDFNQKGEVLERVRGNQMLLQQVQAMQNMIMQLSQVVDQTNGTNISEDMATMFGAAQGQPMPEGGGQISLDVNKGEHPFNQRAREMANESTQVQ